MRRKVADSNDTDARLCGGVVVVYRAAAHADGFDQNAFLVDNWEAARKSDQGVIGMLDSKEGAPRL